MKSVNLSKGILLASLSCALLGGASMLMVGCEPKPTELAPQATDSLNSLRDQLFVAKSQVQRAAAAARDLHDQPRQDLAPQIQKLQSETNALNATRSAAGERGAEFRAETATYFAKWDASMASMSTDTQEAGKKRIAKGKDAVERMRGHAAEVRQELNPFMAELNEACKYLATDTTRPGLDIVKPKLKSAAGREKGILKQMDELIAEIDKIRAGK